MENYLSISTEDLFNKTVVSSIRSRILKSNQEKRIFRLALSGGTTPEKIYEMLPSQDDINWSRVEFYLVDERNVNVQDQRSNFKMINNALFKKLKNKPRKIVYFDTDLSKEEALKKYEKELDTKDKKFFNLVLLGIGEDGHTASLFPGGKELNEVKKWVVISEMKKKRVAHHGHAIRQAGGQARSEELNNITKTRFTLTYPALESSREIFFLIKGKSKAEILKKLEKSKDYKKYPAAKLFSLGNTSVFYCEE